MTAPAAHSEPLRIVTATRLPESRFQESNLARSLAALGRLADVDLAVTFENTEGLPVIYNRAIEAARNAPATLVFMHDDVYIADLLWIDEVRRALDVLAIVGLAGTRKRSPHQATWGMLTKPDGSFEWDHDHISGVVGHGEAPGDFAFYGMPYQQCQLLDGLFLAVRSTTLHAQGLAFDPRFQFHFYDLDFCREAERRGLKMGTAFIKVLHAGKGSYRSEAWEAGKQAYFAKHGA